MSKGAFSATSGHSQKVGVLLVNLGTPAAPTPSALRRYLREFLSDSRVVELPRWLWWPILYLFVLTFRPRRSAALYRRIWWPEGSPLLVISQRQREGLAQRLTKTFGEGVHVALAMRYGKPSIAQGLRELANTGCGKLLVFPLYPQYASATTGSSLQVVFSALGTLRVIPELRTVNSYYDHPGYIKVLAASVREVWERDGRGEHLLFSFHGVPEKTVLAGDPYAQQCRVTAQLVAAELNLETVQWSVAFQSRFGRERWVEPETIAVVRELGRRRLSKLDVLCPGFAADCLETLEEIAMTNREAFQEAGGGRFCYIPALNDRSDHLDALADIVTTHLQGWLPR